MQANILHYWSISLIEEPCRCAHLAAMDIAKKSGCLLSYDPNLRLHFGHLQRLLEMVLWAYGTNLTLLRYIFWHLGTIYNLKYYIKFSSYKFLHAHHCWNYLGELQISEEEITFLTGGDDPYDDDVVLKKLSHPNLKLLLVTEGAQGCRYHTKVSIHIF